MKILAFLQNCWFPADTQIDYVNKYLSDDVFRRRVLARGWTGRRLINSLGEKLFSMIIWDNASVEVGTVAEHDGTPDLNHVEERIEYHKPDLILTFGKTALGAVNLVNRDRIPVLSTKHPSARGFKRHELDSFANKIKEAIK
jgi:hypothetical protein